MNEFMTGMVVYCSLKYLKHTHMLELYCLIFFYIESQLKLFDENSTALQIL